MDTTSSKSATTPSSVVKPLPPLSGTDSKPPRPPLISNEDYDYDDFAVADETFMQEHQKRPLQIPSLNVDTSTGAAESGDYANQAQVDSLADKLKKSQISESVDSTSSRVPVSEGDAMIDKSARISRDSFDSDYEEPIIPPQRTGK